MDIFSDSSRMFCIGEVSPEKKRLVEVTEQAIEEGLKQVKPWGHLGDMGQAIHDMQLLTAIPLYVRSAVTA